MFGLFTKKKPSQAKVSMKVNGMGYYFIVVTIDGTHDYLTHTLTKDINKANYFYMEVISYIEKGITPSIEIKSHICTVTS